MKVSKMFVIGIAVCLFLILGVNFLLLTEKKSFQKNIGKTVIIGKDTATIIDYSTIFDTYKLSNGKTVSKEYVENQK